MSPTVLLRPFEDSDTSDFIKLINASPVYRYLSARLPIPYTEAHMRDFLSRCERGERIERAIIADGQLAGGIGCALPEPGMDAYCMGYWLGKNFWRQGIMTRALQLFLETLRDQLPAGSVVEAKVFAPHAVSQQILLHAGFRQEPGFILMPMRDGLPHITYTYRHSL